jgi:hypothetical protein
MGAMKTVAILEMSVVSRVRAALSEKRLLPLIGIVFRAAAIAVYTTIWMTSAAEARVCFSKRELKSISDNPYAIRKSTQYLLGIDQFLVPASVWFLPSGEICGIAETAPVTLRFVGVKLPNRKMSWTFLSPPTGSWEAAKYSDNSADKELKRIAQHARSIFDKKISGIAEKKQSDQLIIWNGSVIGSDSKRYEFYLKRTPPAAVTQHNKGEAGLAALVVPVLIKRKFESALRSDAQNLPISDIRPSTSCALFPNPVWRPTEMCVEAVAWPYEEDKLVKALKKKNYVRHVARTSNGEGVDTETVYLETDLLLTKNRRLNLPIAIPFFRQAINEHFAGTGVAVSEASYKQNSLFWELKGRRSQFLKISDPSPSDKSEWWQVRLQIAVTDTNVLVVGLPKTRVFAWGLDTVPNDEKFSEELSNDPRFVDLQGRLIVSITKSIPLGMSVE